MFAKKQNKKFADAIIMNDERVSVEGLRKKAKRANTRFWGMAVSMGMVSSLVLPYMSMAAVAPSNSNVFTGHVIPGYSMGGVTLAAYGVDVNSWGEVNKDTVVGSNYGVWSGSRLSTAKSNVQDTSHLMTGAEAQNYELTSKDKAVGWQGITGRMGYTNGSPDGSSSTNAANQYDAVAPYRTVSDYTYWSNRMLESNGAASASINVSLFADFVIVSKTSKGLHVLSSPDEVNTAGSLKLVESANPNSEYNTQGETTATPYYIPLSVLFDAYGLTDSKDASISALMEKIKANATPFNNVVNQGNNLLNSTEYKNVNSGETDTSDAFNPYPYSMVFSMNTDSGEVVSSIYENSEAYVYFSPSSVYSQYIALRTEYERLRNSADSDLRTADANEKAQDAATVFQLGYYLAEMSILESYLDECLPQDMTRGYVGPTECTDLIGAQGVAGNGELGGNVGSSLTGTSDINELQKISYVALMYDFSHNLTGDAWYEGAAAWRQTEIDAIMDTISCFGYRMKSDWSNCPSGTGVMKGMAAGPALTRHTLFGSYVRSADAKAALEGDSSATGVPPESAYSGMYTPCYYPIQQHKMPDSEKIYRFQILSTVPIETMLEYIRDDGFSDHVKFVYSSNSSSGLESFSAITNVAQTRDKVAALAAQYESAEENSEDLDNLSSVTTDNLKVLGGSGSEDENAQRIDAAVTGYQASSMNSDNVHDMFDVVRATNNLKFETWVRYYNPIKSGGGDNDLFLTRVSPALTTYFPAILVNGYSPAGGDQVASALTPYGASFDYFSIPSFAPCFASHTADTSYYGILNYELRPFYSKGFVNSLSKNANIPAMDAYMQAKEAKEEMEQQQEDEAQVTNKNLATLYILGKRVAYARTVQALMTRDFSLSKNDLLVVLNKMIAGASGGDPDEVTTSFVETPVFPLTKLNHVDLSNLYSQLQSDDFPDTMEFNYDEGSGGDQANPDTVGNIRLNGEKELKIDAGSWVGRDYFASRTGIASEDLNAVGASSAVAEDNDAQTFGMIHRDQNFSPWDGGTESRNIKVANGREDMWIPASLIFTAVYDKKFDALLGEGGEYYWDNWRTIFNKMKNDGLEPESADTVEYSDVEKGKYNARFATDWTDQAAQAVGLDIKDCDNISDLITIMTAQMDKASDEIAKSMINLIKDYNLLTKTMPSKMQNCLAWADYQNSTDSEAQYQVDPSNANVVINVGNGDNGQSAPEPEHIRSKEEAKNLALQVDPAEDGNGFVVTNQKATDGEGMELEGRLERGVEGSTWTSTIHPALYTMTATIARVNNMSSTTGTTYPYSGLANGRLQSGTDKYAVMQAHVIDYTSIASGIAGDLSTRQRAQVVSLVEPQFASISDFTDILGILGAMLGEAGSALVKTSSEQFTSAMFDDGAAGVVTSDQPSAHSASSTMAYMMSDGTTMNRTPAALATFNPNTGKLDYGYVSNNTSSNYFNTGTSTASASDNSGMVNTAGYVLTALSLPYKVIQTFALTLVLVFIGFIAFKNFYAYTSGKHGAAVIEAQTHLKTVIWRSVMAVVMIGLPPLAGGTGFEGGNFIVLEVISNIAAFIASIFVGDNGSGIMAFFTNIDMVESFGNNIGLWLLYFLCCLIISFCFFVGTILVFILQTVMLLFFLLGPLVWALFVWPYNVKRDGTATKYMNLGFLSSGAVGNLAPRGHIHGFCVFSAILIAWNLLFWFVAQIFVIGAGVQYSDAAPSGAASLVAQSTGYAGASMAISHAGVVTDFLFGTASGVGYGIRLLLTAVICLLVFALMTYWLFRAIFGYMKDTQGLGHDIKENIKNGVSKANEAWNGTEEKGGIRDGLQAAAAAARVLRKGYDDKPERDRLKKLQKAQKQLNRGNVKKGLPEDMLKFLKEEGYTNEQLTDLNNNPEKAKELAKELGEDAAARKAKLAQQSKDAKEARKLAHWTGEDGKQSVGNMLKNTAKTAKTLASAAKRGDGMQGVWEGLAQTAKTLNEAAIDKESDAIAAESAALESAKAAADKLLADGGKIDEAYLKGLDAEAFNELQKAGLAKVDDSGKRIQTSEAAALAAQASQNLTDKIEKNRQKIQAKERDKDAMVERLNKLGLSKDATLQEGLKVLKDGFDNQKAAQIAQEMGFKDDGDGSALSKAKKYMEDADFRKKCDDDHAGLMQAARMLGVDITNPEGRAAAESLVASRGSMAELCGIEAEPDHGKQLSRLAETSNAIADKLGKMPSEDRAEAIKLATGVYPPKLEEFQGIYERVMDGSATAADFQKFAAMQISTKMAGVDLPLPDKSVGARAAVEALDKFTGVEDPQKFAEEHVITRGKNGVARVDMPMEMASVASNENLSMGIASALSDEALAKCGYSSDMIASLRAAANGIIDPNKSVEENMQAMQSLGAVGKHFEDVILATHDGGKAVGGFEKRAAAKAAVEQREKNVAEAQEQVKEYRQEIATLQANPYDRPQEEINAKLEEAMKNEQAASVLLAEETNALKAMQREAVRVHDATSQFCGEYESLDAYKADKVKDIATLVVGGAALGAVSSYKYAVALDDNVSKDVYASKEIGSRFAAKFVESAGDPAVTSFIEQEIAQKFDGSASMNDIMSMDLSGLPPATQDLVKMRLHAMADDFAHSEGVLDIDPMVKVNMTDEQVSAYYQNVPRSRDAIEHVAAYTGAGDILTRQDNQAIYANFNDFVNYEDEKSHERPYEGLKFDDSFVTCVNYVNSSGATREDLEAFYMKQAGDKATEDQKAEFMKIVDGAIAYVGVLNGAGLGDTLTKAEKKERAKIDRNIEMSGGKARTVSMTEAPKASKEREDILEERAQGSKKRSNAPKQHPVPNMARETAGSAMPHTNVPGSSQGATNSVNPNVTPSFAQQNRAQKRQPGVPPRTTNPSWKNKSGR